jgi:hypothetical protein
MKKIYRLISALTIMMFLLLPTGAVHAQGPDGGGKIVFGQDFTLESGETLSGDLIVFGGNVTIEQDAIINGSVVVFGGNVEFAEDSGINGDMVMIGGNMEVNGTLDRDLVVIGGQIDLTDTAVVHGNISTVGGQVSRDPNAQVDGDILENIPAPAIQIPDLPVRPNLPDVPNVPDLPPQVIRIDANPFAEAVNVVLRAFAVAALAMLLALFLQPQLERVSEAVVRQPVVAGSFGLLAAVLAPVTILILVITIILIPVALLVLIILPLAWLFGIIALGQEVGERFTQGINQTWTPVLSTGFGTFLLMLVGGYIGMIPCVGWLAPFLIGVVGIGGVILTFFGSRPATGTLSIQPVDVPPAS